MGKCHSFDFEQAAVLVNMNPALAWEVCAADDKVDALNRRVYEYVETSMFRDVDGADRARRGAGPPGAHRRLHGEAVASGWLKSAFYRYVAGSGYMFVSVPWDEDCILPWCGYWVCSYVDGLTLSTP